MSISGTDLRKLWLPISVAVCCIAAGAGVVLWAQQDLARAQTARKAAADARKEAAQRVARSTDEEKELRDNLALFNAMVRRGMVGPEQRLDWIDSIASIKAARKFFEIRYSMEPQKTVDYPGVTPMSGDGELMLTRMKLEMLLLHEGDLMTFLSDLSGVAGTYVSVRSCNLGRNPVDPGPQARVAPRLKADCVIDLITVKEGRARVQKG